MIYNEISLMQIEERLASPREDPTFEIKNRLSLKDAKKKITLAKAIMAPCNQEDGCNVPRFAEAKTPF
jgi:hypothetical protein